GESDVNSLSAASLPTMHGDENLRPRLEQLASARKDINRLVFPDESLLARGERSVEINLRVLVVKDEQLKLRGDSQRRGQRHFAAQPDIVRGPAGIGGDAGGTGGAERTASALPLAVVEIRQG